MSARLAPLLGIPDAARLAGMSRWAFLRWVRARAKDIDSRTLQPRWPDLLQKVRRRLFVQAASLEGALGRTHLQLEAFALETSDRVDGCELDIRRIKERIGMTT